MCCLKAFVSNLQALYGSNGAAKYPTNGNMSTAVKPLTVMGLSSQLKTVYPTVAGKTLSSRSKAHNKSSYYNGIKFTGSIDNNILNTISDMTEDNGIGIFAVGIAADYHSTLMVVVKNPRATYKATNGVVYQGSNNNPFYIFVEDIGGARLGTNSQMNPLINDFIKGARAYYRGDKSVDGKSYPNSSDDVGLGTNIYQLYHP